MTLKTLGRDIAQTEHLCTRHSRQDRVLVQVGEGDRDALALLYDDLARTVYGMSLNSGHGPTLSAEVTQEVFLQVWRQAGSYVSKNQSAWTWVRALALASIDSRSGTPPTTPPAVRPGF